MKIFVPIEIFKEDDAYVAVSPELNVSSFGETLVDAKNSIKEALEAFFEECEIMGTLEDVLEESGFSKTTRYKNLPKAGSRGTYSHKYDNSRDDQGTIL